MLNHSDEFDGAQRDSELVAALASEIAVLKEDARKILMRRHQMVQWRRSLLASQTAHAQQAEHENEHE